MISFHVILILVFTLVINSIVKILYVETSYMDRYPKLRYLNFDDCVTNFFNTQNDTIVEKLSQYFITIIATNHS